jgi:hypothetical protein
LERYLATKPIDILDIHGAKLDKLKSERLVMALAAAARAGMEGMVPFLSNTAQNSTTEGNHYFITALGASAALSMYVPGLQR